MIFVAGPVPSTFHSVVLGWRSVDMEVVRWRRLLLLEYLILDRPVGISKPKGIEASDQVARKKQLSIFNAKRGAEFLQP